VMYWFRDQTYLLQKFEIVLENFRFSSGLFQTLLWTFSILWIATCIFVYCLCRFARHWTVTRSTLTSCDVSSSIHCQSSPVLNYYTWSNRSLCERMSLIASCSLSVGHVYTVLVTNWRVSC